LTGQDRNVVHMSRVTLQELVARARATITRLKPTEAWAAAEEGAFIVDIRAVRESAIPGSLHVPRTVFEWRLDPESPWRSPYAPGLGDRVIVVCDHGDSSSLAAATLVELGFERVADVIGGTDAWAAAGLPLAPPAVHDGLTGAGPPES